MQIYTVKVGYLETNCYLVVDETSKETLIIDPGDEPEKILAEIKKYNLKSKYIINTHGHYDHITANAEVQKLTGAAILDLGFGAYFEVGILRFEIIECPGHTEDGISIYRAPHLFTGDTLFADGDVGRADLPGSSIAKLRESVAKLLSFPPETIIYPGHGPTSTIGREKQYHE